MWTEFTGQRGSGTRVADERIEGDTHVTIYEHHRVSADRDGIPTDTHALVDRLTSGEAYAVAFGGQGGAWLETLEELVSSSGIESELATLVGEVDLLRPTNT
jgi:fatty acid synthase